MGFLSKNYRDDHSNCCCCREQEDWSGFFENQRDTKEHDMMQRSFNKPSTPATSKPSTFTKAGPAKQEPAKKAPASAPVKTLKFKAKNGEGFVNLTGLFVKQGKFGDYLQGKDRNTDISYVVETTKKGDLALKMRQEDGTYAVITYLKEQEGKDGKASYHRGDSDQGSYFVFAKD